jgi:hypothetical protein
MTVKVEPWLAEWIEENRLDKFQDILKLAGSTREIIRMELPDNYHASLRDKIMFVAEAMLNGYEVDDGNNSGIHERKASVRKGLLDRG